MGLYLLHLVTSGFLLLLCDALLITSVTSSDARVTGSDVRFVGM